MNLTKKIKEFSEKVETPFLVIDINQIEKNYNRIKNSVDNSEIFYAIKANSDKRILKKLIDLGSSFDIASKGELDLMLDLGAKPEKISFGNPIKKEKHIKYAYEKGVRLFVADEYLELEKIARNAPDSMLFVRIEMSDADSDWPLTKKFGTNMFKAKDLLIKSKSLGLIPYGVTFHVGSQCYDKYMWKRALFEVEDIFTDLKEEGINLKMINTGGGIPIKHVREIPEIESIGNMIENTVRKLFDDPDELRIIMEPGRSLVGDSAILVSEVVLVSEKQKNDWIFLDVGVFNGLMETIENFQYDIIVPNRIGEEKTFTLSGPSCDSVDTMYDEIWLPEDVTYGDKVFIINAGAYTLSYASNFNGLDIPKVYYLDEIE